MGRRNAELALDMSATHEDRAFRTARKDSASSDETIAGEPRDEVRSASPVPPNNSSGKPLTAISSLHQGSVKKDSSKKNNFSVASLLGRRDEPETEDDDEEDDYEAASGRREDDNSSPENINEQKLAFQRRLYESCLPDQMSSLHNGFAMMSNEPNRFVHPLAHQMPWLPNLQHCNQNISPFGRSGPPISNMSSRKCFNLKLQCRDRRAPAL